MRGALLVVVLLAIGCRETTEPAGVHATRPKDEAADGSPNRDAVDGAIEPQAHAVLEPVTVTVGQRSTSVLPIPDQHVRLTIDDVTRGQVMASLSLENGTSLHAPLSLQPGLKLAFEVDGRAYQLQLTQLHNRLVGEDTAEFLLSSRQESSRDASQKKGPPRLPEREKIEHLIEAVAQQPDAVFVRNGREHSAAEAAEHLRRKWEAAGDRVTTADAFIEHVATRSSLSGTAYSIRFPDGSEMTSAEFLRDELRKLESTPEE